MSAYIAQRPVADAAREKPTARILVLLDAVEAVDPKTASAAARDELAHLLVVVFRIPLKEEVHVVAEGTLV